MARVLVFLLFSFLNLSVVLASSDISIERIRGYFSSMRPDSVSIFMRINNHTPIDDSLIGCRVSIPEVVVELHNVKDGSMFKVEKINVPANGSVELKRGGFHIMLFNVPIDIMEGQEVGITLIFEKAGEKALSFKLERMKDMHMH